MIVFISFIFNVTMNKYFADFEFSTAMGNHYWFPIFIFAKDEKQAQENTNAIATAIKEHYILKKQASPKLIMGPVGQLLVNDHISKRQKGKLEILQIAVWKFKQLPAVPELSFNEHTQLVEKSFPYREHEIARSIEQHKIPVTVIKKKMMGFDEFLLINVVDQTK